MIKFIYFDVGGVAIRDFSGTGRWADFIKEIGITDAQAEAFRAVWDEHEQEFSIGRELDVILPVIEEDFGIQLPKEYTLLNGLVSRFAVNPPIWPAIEYARSKARVGLLTNMFNGMLDAINDRQLLPPGEWAAVVDSSIEMLKKPDHELFKLAEKRAGFSGQEILFIDNTAGHIEAAKAFGWQTFLYDSADVEQSSNELLKLLKNSL